MKAEGTIFKRGKVFYYQNKKHGISASLKTKDEKEAKKIASEKFGYLMLDNEKEYLESVIHKRDKLAAKSEEIRQESTINKKSILLNVEEIFVKYLEVLKITASKRTLHTDAENLLAPRTIRDDRNRLGQFITWIRINHPTAKKMNQVTPLMAREYFIDKRKAKANANTYNRHRSTLNGIFDRLRHEAGINESPFLAVDEMTRAQVSREASPKLAFTEEQLLIIAKKATDWYAVAVKVSFYTGLRLSDVMTLRWSVIDFNNSLIDLSGIVLDSDGKKIVSRKGSKSQQFYCPELMPALIEWKEELTAKHKKLQKTDSPIIEYVFPAHAARILDIYPPGIRRYKNKGPNTSYTSTKFQKFLKEECGFDVKDNKGKTVLGFHSLRKAHATIIKALGASDDTVQGRLGHSAFQTTAGYIQPSEQQKREELISKHIPLSIEGNSETRDQSLLNQISSLAEMISDTQTRIAILAITKPFA